MEDTNIDIDTSKLSFIKDVLINDDKMKNNIRQTKIKSDCATLKKAFEDLINNDLPNSVDKIIKNKRILGKDFQLQYISMNSEIIDECKIDTEKISKQIQDITGKFNDIELKCYYDNPYAYNHKQYYALKMDFL